MSVSHIGEASFPSPNALLINNNDASTVNQNLKQEAATAEEASCPKSPEQDPTSWPELGGTTSSPAFSFIKSSPHKEQESPILNQEESPHQLFPVNDVTALISPQVASNPEVLPKSILKPKICQDELLSEHDSKDDEVPRAASLPKRSIKYSTDSITTSSQTKNSSESGSGSLSQIPVPVSTMTKSSRKRSRKNSITKVAGANRLSECIYEAMIWGDGEDNSANMSDGYIDEIIQQSSKKSTDRGLDSSGDFLDDSEEVFEEEERRKEARDNMMKRK